MGNLDFWLLENVDFGYWEINLIKFTIYLKITNNVKPKIKNG